MSRSQQKLREKLAAFSISFMRGDEYYSVLDMAKDLMSYKTSGLSDIEKLAYKEAENLYSAYLRANTPSSRYLLEVKYYYTKDDYLWAVRILCFMRDCEETSDKEGNLTIADDLVQELSHRLFPTF